MIYFTADLHFGSEKILTKANRPFASIEEMDQCLIANWNNIVSAKDTVYVIGDIGIHNKPIPARQLKQLNGTKHLIRGNHDTCLDDQHKLFDYFESVTDFLEIDEQDIHITLCHYPIVYYQHGYMIHGHIHNTKMDVYEILKQLPCVLNAGVDVNHYRPVGLAELIENNRQHYRDPKRGHMRSRWSANAPSKWWKADFRPLPVKNDVDSGV